MKKNYSGQICIEYNVDYEVFPKDNYIVITRDRKSVIWKDVLDVIEAISKDSSIAYCIYKKLPHNWYAYRIEDKCCIVPGNSSKNYCIKQIKEFKEK